MATRTIPPERVRTLNGEPVREGGWVLYWMQQSQRAETNPALEHAVRRANGLGLPLVVAFGLTDGWPGANLRHYRFMLEGLAQTAGDLERRGIGFVLRRGDPADVALGLARDAALVVCDRGYLRHQVAWRERVAAGAGCRVERVEGDVVVPVEVASDHAEHAARTLRPKIHRHLRRFLVELATTPLERPGTGLGLDGLEPSDVDGVLGRLDIDRSVPPVTPFFEGGTSRAKARLRRFAADGLERYGGHRNQPHADDTSTLSPYLHFGQVSPVWVALEVDAARAGTHADREAFLEQLVVRRELAVNRVRFDPRYDRWGALPGWARRTLDEHRDDPRGHVYTRTELERGETHDPYWNAAQREMRYTGWMHNHMRMYWGKKVLEWSRTPEAAFRTLLHLNDTWFLDGRDPSSYANVGWIFGLHDRAWNERDVFGKVRWMSRGGLERKTDPDAYVEKVERLVARARRAGIRFEGE